MESSTSIDHRVTTATEKLRSFQERLNQLKLVRFPSNNPKLLIELFQRIGTALQNKLTNYRAAFLAATQTEIRHGITREIVFSVMLVKTLAARLRYIEGASIERTPWSMVHAVEKLAQGLVQNTLLIIRPQWHYNYGGLDVIEEWKSDITPDQPMGEEIFNQDEWRTILDQLPEHFYILSFPGLERENVLLHVSLGHEIGHLVLDEFLIQEDLSSVNRIKSQVQTILERSYESAPLLLDAEVEAQVNRIRKIRRRALEEIVADIFAVNLFGPAAIFALHEVAVFARSMDRVSENTEWYPPWRTRLRYALAELNWEQWKNQLEGLVDNFRWNGQRIKGARDVLNAVDIHVTRLNRISAEQTDQTLLADKPQTRIAYESLDDAVLRAKSFLQNKITEAHRFEGNKDACQNILALVERLHFKIPPNEIQSNSGARRIADLGSIFNAGWFYRIAYLPSVFEFDDPVSYFNELDILNRLVLKAIEMSDLQRDYEDYSQSRA